MILPGTIDPLPALHDEALVAFLRRGIGTNTVFAAISSAPLLLCRAGLLPALAGGLSACNTVKGAGQDLKSAGQAIERKAEEKKHY